MATLPTERRLEDMLAQCMLELLSELGGRAERVLSGVPAVAIPDGIAAFSGFGSTQLRGSFTLVGPNAVFARLHPLPPSFSPRDLADWACELVNQVVGRFRNQLLGYGVTLAPGVPQSALGERVRLSSSFRPGRVPIAFRVEGMVLQGWLELSLKPGFELPEAPSDEKAAALREGSLIFF